LLLVCFQYLPAWNLPSLSRQCRERERRPHVCRRQT
jgi:hypothetical protein